MNRAGVDRSEYTKSDVTVIALYYLGGASRHVHQEDVALKAAELSPKAFSWKKYPEQVNLEVVRLALKRELGTRNGRVAGSIKEGWMLTPEGLSWCLTDSSGGLSRSHLESVYKEIARVRKTDAFCKIEAARPQDVSDSELKALLRVDEYFSLRNRRERMLALANAGVVDPQLNQVLIILRQRGLTGTEAER